MDNRREHPRLPAWLPVELEVDGAATSTVLAVGRDASAGGIALSTAAPVAVGAKVRITLRVPEVDASTAGAELSVVGTVIRAGSNPDDPHGLWPHRVAIAFHDLHPDVVTFIEKAVRALRR